MERVTKISIFLILLFMPCLAMSSSNKEIVEVQLDSDKDGLSDLQELKFGTDKNNKDTDHDGLSDYWEIRKYKTNPLNIDSDSDGKVDFDWDERREYTYTIEAVVDLKPPFNIDHMNDFFQDARILEIKNNNVTRIQVLLYPEAEILYNAKEYQPVYDEYSKKTYSKNYSKEMMDKTTSITKNVKTDFEAVNKILNYFNRRFKYISMKDLKYKPEIPIQFNYYLDENKKLISSNLGLSNKYTNDEILEMSFFADTMFKNKTRGACISTSTIRGALLRSAGIREKSVFTIPLIYYNSDEDVTIKLKEKYSQGYYSISGLFIADHVFNTVYVGNQWVWVDDEFETSLFVDSDKRVVIKILEYNDSLDYNFPKYWNVESWEKDRPYKYISIIEKEKVYQNAE